MEFSLRLIDVAVVKSDFAVAISYDSSCKFNQKQSSRKIRAVHMFIMDNVCSINCFLFQQLSNSIIWARGFSCYKSFVVEN